MFYHILVLIILSIALIVFQSKYFFLVDQPQKQKHKLDFNKNVPLTGGLYFFLSIAYYLLIGNSLTNLYIILFIFLFLILGIYSDIKIDFSPKLRLLIQATLLICLILFVDLKINKTNIFFIDYFIENKIFNILFTLSCIIVLLNGSNFCDGINVNVVGYFLIVLLIIANSSLIKPDFFLKIENLIPIFFIFYCFNLFGKCFLGDNGVYITSIIISIYVINLVNLNPMASPILALNLLWYPAFENLFTIARRLVSKNKIQIADRLHLHVLIFEKISKKKKINFSNSISGICLNIFMFMGIFFSMENYNSSKALALILLLNISFYIISYIFLFLNRSK